MKLRNRKILVVEDCPDQQRLMVKFLMSAGAHTELECDGLSAVRTVQKYSKRGEQPFDAIVMDLALPYSDGIAATEQILEIVPQLAIVAVTANGSTEVERAWRKAGCVEYLEKPLQAKKFVDAVARAITLIEIEQSVLHLIEDARPFTVSISNAQSPKSNAELT